MLDPYRRILAQPGTFRFSMSALVGRLPISMLGLGLVLMVQAATGSYALAGAMSATAVVAEAAVALLHGRLLDSYGQFRVLPTAIVLFSTSLAFVIVVVQTGAPHWTWFVGAAVAGMSLPQIGASVRARWAHVLDSPAQVQTAFALESVLDEVVFVPTGQPWQKADRQVSVPEDRYLMTTIATASNPRFSVSRVDIDRPGSTYTLDTLRDLREHYGDDVDLFFITGADALSQILTWHGVLELFDLAHFVGVTRPGTTLGESDISHLPPDKVTLLEVPALAISSTDCRNRVRAHLPIWSLVPDGIVQYIAKRGLYR